MASARTSGDDPGRGGPFVNGEANRSKGEDPTQRGAWFFGMACPAETQPPGPSTATVISKAVAIRRRVVRPAGRPFSIWEM